MCTQRSELRMQIVEKTLHTNHIRNIVSVQLGHLYLRLQYVVIKKKNITVVEIKYH